jgi:hypothetical protein
VCVCVCVCVCNLEACISVLVPSQPRIQRVLKRLPAKLKLPKREADNSPSSSAKIKNAGTYNPTTPSHFLALAGATTNCIFGSPSIHRGLFSEALERCVSWARRCDLH